MKGLSESFPRYEKHSPEVEVRCVTPGKGGVLHRFFDTSPFSPSGRYLCGFRMPYEDRLPSPGDAGEIVVVDLQEGSEKVVATTRGWESQMGANLQWGKDDGTLVFNDVDVESWTPCCVELDWRSGRKKVFKGASVYHVSPDGTKAVASSPLTMRCTQSGYGVVVPDEKVPQRDGPQESDGIWILDLESGERRMLVSSKEVFERAMPEAEREAAKGQAVYCFHSKWNFDGSRIMFSMRRTPRETPRRLDAMRNGIHIRFDVFTIKPDGTELHNAIPAELWERGGHHTTWMADGKRLSFNLGDLKGGVDLMQVRFDGSGLGKLCETKGSGHPSERQDGKGIFVTDTYVREPLAYGDGTTPIRLIDLAKDSERRIVRINSYSPHESKDVALRVDPHVAWDRQGKRIAFNAFEDGTRRIYVADMSGIG